MNRVMQAGSVLFSSMCLLQISLSDESRHSGWLKSSMAQAVGAIAQGVSSEASG
jgi:hypothetical protein